MRRPRIQCRVCCSPIQSTSRCNLFANLSSSNRDIVASFGACTKRLYSPATCPAPWAIEGAFCSTRFSIALAGLNAGPWAGCAGLEAGSDFCGPFRAGAAGSWGPDFIAFVTGAATPFLKLSSSEPVLPDRPEMIFCSSCDTGASVFQKHERGQDPCHRCCKRIAWTARPAEKLVALFREMQLRAGELTSYVVGLGGGSCFLASACMGRPVAVVSAIKAASKVLWGRWLSSDAKPCCSGLCTLAAVLGLAARAGLPQSLGTAKPGRHPGLWLGRVPIVVCISSLQQYHMSSPRKCKMAALPALLS